MIQADEMLSIVRHNRESGMANEALRLLSEVSPQIKGAVLLHSMFDFGYVMGIDDERDHRQNAESKKGKNMNEIKVFSYGATEMRTIIEGTEARWVLRDVCEVLGLGSPHKVAERLDEDEKGRNLIPTLGGDQEMVTITEAGLYNVILRSDKPEAKAFKRWVTHEVLPAIRKTGSYTTPGADLQRQRAEAMLLNAKARNAALWYKLGMMLPESPQHKQICASYASEVLTGKKVIALPAVEKTYSATEIGQIYGISSQKVGSIANANGLKTPENGITVMDKSRYSSKEVPTFRYNERGMRAIGEYLQ